MFRKLSLFFTTVLLFSLTTIQLQAVTIPFNYVNFYATNYGLVSSCITIPISSDILTIDVPENDYTDFSTAGGVDSSVALYSDTSCLAPTTPQGFELYELNPSTNVNNTYFLEFDFLIPAQTVQSFTLTLATTLTAAAAPAGYVTFMSNNTTYTTTTPNIVRYFSEGGFYQEAYFILNVPQPLTGDPTKAGFTFQYWKDINGDVYNFQLPPTAEQLDANNVFYLEAVFFKDFTITAPVPGLPPGVDEPLDIILFNTGFFNTPGFVLLYFIVIMALNVGLWTLGSTSIPTLIANIAVTSFFIFFGYLPIYISILMITFFITIIIAQGKGGLFNE